MIAFISQNAVCKSKNQGGLGLINLNLMNQVLWLIRFKDLQSKENGRRLSKLNIR